MLITGILYECTWNITGQMTLPTNASIEKQPALAYIYSSIKASFVIDNIFLRSFLDDIHYHPSTITNLDISPKSLMYGFTG